MIEARKKLLTADRKSEAGYTLLELLIVIAILALIMAFAAPQVIHYLSRSKTKAAEIQISDIAAALDLYRLDVGTYPTQKLGLQALLARPTGLASWQGPYLTRRDGIIDPWGRPYIYQLQQGDKPFVVLSLGADGKPGGDGEDSDVTSDH
jgi:general secretion pathway protein G